MQLAETLLLSASELHLLRHETGKKQCATLKPFPFSYFLKRNFGWVASRSPSIAMALSETALAFVLVRYAELSLFPVSATKRRHPPMLSTSMRSTPNVEDSACSFFPALANCLNLFASPLSLSQRRWLEHRLGGMPLLLCRAHQSVLPCCLSRFLLGHAFPSPRDPPP